MRLIRTPSHAVLLALCAALPATALAASADAKRHSQRGHHRHHRVTRSHRAAVTICRDANDVPTAATVTAARASILCLVNNERLKRGLSPLTDNARLDRAAARHSADMVVNHYFAHPSPTGTNSLSRIRQSGYLSSARGWTVGENIAWGAGALATPDAIVRAWMNSAGHRANILRGAFREVGTGVIAAAPVAGLTDPGATYTQDFGRRG